MQWNEISQIAQTLATIAAALAAVGAAIEAARSRKLVEAAGRPLPVVTATLMEGSPYDDADASVLVQVRNRADVGMTVERAEIHVAGYELAAGGFTMDCDLHVERPRANSEANEQVFIVYLARAPNSFSTRRPSMDLRVRWQDHAAQTQAINVTIVKLKLTSESQ